MMDKMTEVFLDEANDLLDRLEELLLTLEDHPDDAETISAVFRTMHTIKGSSAMFGFEIISRFTHEVETAFDYVRNGKVAVVPEIITLTLQTRDHIRNLLIDEKNEEYTEVSQNIITQFQNYIKNNATIPQSLPEIVSEKQANAPVSSVKKSTKQKGENLENIETTYRIVFKPSKDVFMNGTRPNGLLAELADMGTSSITAHATHIPTLSEIDPNLCYMYWDIILTTSATKNDIEDVFIFLDKKSSIKIEKIATQDETEEITVKKLGEILIEKNITSAETIQAALSTQKPLGKVLLEKAAVPSEDITAALAEQQHLKVMQEKKAQSTNSQTIKVNSEKLDQLIDLVGELVTFNARLGQLSQTIQHPVLLSLGEQGERLILELRDTTMDMRMLPIGTIFSRFRRLVRDLSSEMKKDIELYTEGADTELDKTVIEKLNDPLVHLIRNSVDHGIEKPEARRTKGKKPQGRVLLKAQHAGAFVLITIEDDGAGLNKESIKQKAIEKNLIAPNTELTDTEVCDLIFMAGFSTAEKITSVSGRGVGMDVVKKDITALGGTITTSTKEGSGTKFVLKLPLTLAIIEGMLIKIGKNSFVIPLSSVIECLEFKRPKNDTKMCSYINVRNDFIPYIDLRNFFEVCDPCPQVEQVVIVNDQDSKIGLIIDKVIGNYQTVIKPLGRLYKHVTGLSGATILGDGSVALILDVYKLSDIIRELDLNNDRKTDIRF